MAQKRATFADDVVPRKRRSSSSTPFVLQLGGPEKPSVAREHAALPVSNSASGSAAEPTSFAVHLKADKLLGYGLVANAHARVTSIAAGTAAKAAGIQTFDRIVAIDKIPIDKVEDPLAALSKALGRAEVAFAIERPASSEHDLIAEKENRPGSSPFQSRPPVSKESPRPAFPPPVPPRVHGRAPIGGARKSIDKAIAATPAPRCDERRVVVRRDGRGTILGMSVTTKDVTGMPRCVVTGIAPGSPVDGSGLQLGDVVVSVNGVELKGTTLGALMQRRKLRNATEITLVVRHAVLDETTPTKVSLSDPRCVAMSADL